MSLSRSEDSQEEKRTTIHQPVVWWFMGRDMRDKGICKLWLHDVAIRQMIW